MKPLSARQQKLLEHLANGWTYKEYGYMVGTSARSVTAMATTICRRLEAVNVPNAVHEAWKKGILK